MLHFEQYKNNSLCIYSNNINLIKKLMIILEMKNSAILLFINSFLK
ncbi:hypothetical protein VHP8226_01164 [Vibrio hippocampi]|uniref:Uncharacterized protein n=1 Tax=Vibrio hippocampi TaxID=654686 RepID=A0ABM8ZGZ5_9VIBR|nr:hypothetical protein VHP8226_01164 [Vibrio hippocampi]